MVIEQDSAAAAPIAAQLVHDLHVLIKAAAVYGPNNAGYLQHSARAGATLRKALEDEGSVQLESRDEQLFFNRLRIRFPTEGTAGARFLMDEMKRRGLGAVEFSSTCDQAQLDAFAFAFNAVQTRKGEGLDKLRGLLRAAGAAAVAVQKIAETEEAQAAPAAGDGASAAKKTFTRALCVVEDIMAQARAGQPVDFVQAKRVVHGLVDRVLEDEQALFELTALRDYDEYTYAHCVNVCVYSVAVGVRLGLERAQLAELGFGALFHDIGKVKLPLALINKPDEFDDSEWETMRRHPVLGARELLGMRRPYDRALARAVSMAFEHHLKADGSGYPRLRQARRQDVFSRICALADSFDALTSGRVYTRKPLAPDEALRRMAEDADVAYDPALLVLLIAVVGVFPIGTVLALDTGELAVVRRNNPGDLLHPVLEVFADANGERAAVEAVDLSLSGAQTGQPPREIQRAVDPHACGLDTGALLARRSP
ncbi:MAG: hypothetical protein A2V88_04230 [Elusimicrobia bacterium RBG_16_66_12]|nr:MAG: hypothetical protein A2V88_04230 [Elusimicrobia bacterium RBG_16_66_12]